MAWGSTAHGRQNTDFLKGNEVKFYRPPEPAANSIYLGFSQWVFTVTKCGRIVTVATNLGGHMKASMVEFIIMGMCGSTTWGKKYTPGWHGGALPI